REVFKGITLGFYKGAKIGVIGGNGSGKSSLLRILALKEEPTSGQILPQKGLRIGFLPQEPVLDAGATVRENVEPALAHVRALLEQPDFLLLDEPTNHLDADTVAWLETHLRDYPGTVILVTHDRYFLDNVAKWMLELERGEGTPYEGNYTLYLEQKSARLAAEE